MTSIRNLSRFFCFLNSLIGRAIWIMFLILPVGPQSHADAPPGQIDNKIISFFEYPYGHLFYELYYGPEVIHNFPLKKYYNELLRTKIIPALDAISLSHNLPLIQADPTVKQNVPIDFDIQISTAQFEDPILINNPNLVALLPNQPKGYSVSILENGHERLLVKLYMDRLGFVFKSKDQHIERPDAMAQLHKLLIREILGTVMHYKQVGTHAKLHPEHYSQENLHLLHVKSEIAAARAGERGLRRLISFYEPHEIYSSLTEELEFLADEESLEKVKWIRQLPSRSQTTISLKDAAIRRQSICSTTLNKN